MALFSPVWCIGHKGTLFMQPWKLEGFLVLFIFLLKLSNRPSMSEISRLLLQSFFLELSNFGITCNNQILYKFFLSHFKTSDDCKNMKCILISSFWKENKIILTTCIHEHFWLLWVLKNFVSNMCPLFVGFTWIIWVNNRRKNN